MNLKEELNKLKDKLLFQKENTNSNEENSTKPLSLNNKVEEFIKWYKKICMMIIS